MRMLNVEIVNVKDDINRMKEGNGRFVKDVKQYIIVQGNVKK